MENFGVRSRNINSQREKSPMEEIGQGGEDYFFLAVVMCMFSSDAE